LPTAIGEEVGRGRRPLPAAGGRGGRGHPPRTRGPV